MCSRARSSRRLLARWPRRPWRTRRFAPTSGTCSPEPTSSDPTGRGGSRSHRSCGAMPGSPRSAWSSVRSPAWRSGTRKRGRPTWTSTRTATRRPRRRFCPGCSDPGCSWRGGGAVRPRSARFRSWRTFPGARDDERAGTCRHPRGRLVAKSARRLSSEQSRKGGWIMAAHVPVLLGRGLALFEPALAGGSAVLVDATVGLGGHADALLSAHPSLTLVGLDRDPNALARSSERLARHGDRVQLVHAVYDEMPEVLTR